MLESTKDSNNEFHSFYGAPAQVWGDGAKLWFHHGDIHRKDGPAYTEEDGYIEWWVNGTCINDPVTFQQHTKHSDEQMAEILLKYGPIE